MNRDELPPRTPIDLGGHGRVQGHGTSPKNPPPSGSGGSAATREEVHGQIRWVQDNDGEWMMTILVSPEEHQRFLTFAPDGYPVRLPAIPEHW
jgi:hypothetical protein